MKQEDFWKTQVLEMNSNPLADNESKCSESLDSFHRGGFFLVQPKGTGHRAGLDAMLLASLVPDEAKGELADFGAGAGAAGFAVANRVTGLKVTLVERSSDMVRFAQRSVDLQENQALSERLTVIEADVSLAGAKRRAVGLQDNYYDHVIMNPPFNDGAHRTTPDPLKAEAHAMDGPVFDTWIKSASAVARSGGQLSLISRPQSLTDILHACENRFGAVHLTPVHPRSSEPANRILISAIKGSRAPLSVHPALFVHSEEGRAFSPQVDDLCNGRSWLRR